MSALDILRAEYKARGWTAESPVVLDREAEVLAAEEKRDA